MSEEQSTPTEQTEVASTAETQTEAPATETTTEHPEWFKASKYKTIEDQAKAYGELESKLGGFTGKPEEYTLGEGIEVDAENALFKGLQEIGGKYNMNNDMYNELISMYNGHAQAEAEAMTASEMAALGENAQGRIQNVQDWVKANMPADMANDTLLLGRTAGEVKALEALIGMTKGTKIAPPDTVTSTPEFSEEAYKEMRFATDEHGRRLMSVDPAYKAKVQKYAQNLHDLQNG
jgi:hypothetical protein